MIASHNGFFDVVKYLVEIGADIFARNYVRASIELLDSKYPKII